VLISHLQYGEYKLEFKRQKLNEFFVLHKNQEWFKLKYHPVDSAQRAQLTCCSVKRRCEVFQVPVVPGILPK
jgi:hypothetical protein